MLQFTINTQMSAKKSRAKFSNQFLERICLVAPAVMSIPVQTARVPCPVNDFVPQRRPIIRFAIALLIAIPPHGVELLNVW